MRKAGIEHRLVVDEGLRPAEIQYRGCESPQRSEKPFAVVDRARVAAHDAHDQPPVQLDWYKRQRRCSAVHDHGHELVGSLGDPVAIEAQQTGRFGDRPEDRPGQHHRPERVQPELELRNDAEVASAPT